MRRFLPLILLIPCQHPITKLHKEFYSTLQNNSLGTTPKVLGVIMSKLIHLIFNYRLRLVGLELTQNICEGRGVLMVSWKYLNKQKIERSFKMKNRVKLLRIQLLSQLNQDKILN